MARRSKDPWRIQFFQRAEGDDPKRRVPAIEFLDSIPPKVCRRDPCCPRRCGGSAAALFSGGGKWEAMHDDMAGYFEVRVQGGGMNHRLFCILERDAEDLGGSSIVCIDGLSKPPRTAAHPRDYRRVKRYGAEFQKRRTVLE